MRTVVSWDTETALIRPGRAAPELACLTWQSQGSEPNMASREYATHLMCTWLGGNALFVGHNVAYDFAVMGAHAPALVPAIFDAYDADRVTDTMLRQKLLDIAAGQYRGKMAQKGQWKEITYDLGSVARRVAGMNLQKDGWRMFYGEFLGVPLDRWPEHARTVQAKFAPHVARYAAIPERDRTKEQKQALADLTEMTRSDPGQCVKYPLDDASATLAVYLAQEAHAEFLHDQYRQARKDFWLKLASTWGLRTRREGVDRLRRETEAALEQCRAALVSAGLVRAKDGSRDTKEAAARMATAYRVKFLDDLCEGEPDNVDTWEVLHRLSPAIEDEWRQQFRGQDPPASLPEWATALLPLSKTDVSELTRACQLFDARTVRRTPKGALALDADACALVGDPVMESYADYSTLGAVLSKDCAALERGTVYPIHTKFDLADTGRTTSSKPNVQNWRRSGGKICPKCWRVYE